MKKYNFKKILSLFLAVATFIIMVNIVKAVTYASAGNVQSGKCGDDVYWTLSDGTFTVSGKGDMYSYLSDRPEWFERFNDIRRVVIEKGVTSIGDNAFKYMVDLRTVIIPDTVVTIGFGAFSDCSMLSSVTLPKSLKTICGNAFSSCVNLTSIEIPSSVTVIDHHAFDSCSRLSSVSIGESVTYIGIEVFRGAKIYNNPDNWVDGVLYIDDCLIATNSTIPANYTIKEGTRLIAGYAFRWNHSLSSVTMPNSLLYIGVRAFDECRNLKSVTFSNSLLAIETWAFAECSNLESIVLPQSLKRIENAAFSGCDKLANITLPDSLEYMGGGVFRDTAFYKNRNNWSWGKALYCGNVLLRVESDSGNSRLELKDGTRIIAGTAVWEVKKLEEVIIPDSVKYICSNAFQHCENLEKVTLSEGLKKIHSNAFYDCKKLKTVTIPESVSLIENMAFGYFYEKYSERIYTIKDFTINGVWESEAQKYADKNEFAFVGTESSKNSSIEDTLQSETSGVDTNSAETGTVSDENSKSNTEDKVNATFVLWIAAIVIIIVGITTCLVWRKKTTH